MESVKEKAAHMQQKAREIMERTGLIKIWESVGADPHLVGSLRMGLLMIHRDIDLHIYSDPLRIEDSFAAMGKLAGIPGIRRIEYRNLLDAEDECLEWHVWYEDNETGEWQFDMIHMPRGSRYDGYFEKLADRIIAVSTPEIRETILRLKYETPPTEKVMGILYYQAVIRDGVRNYAEFSQWLKEHPVEGIIKWIP